VVRFGVFIRELTKRGHDFAQNIDFSVIFSIFQRNFTKSRKISPNRAKGGHFHQIAQNRAQFYQIAQNFTKFLKVE
jgi:hypothetical protein